MATKPETSHGQSALAGTKIKWDDSNMKSSYANVCNVTSAREDVVMLLGMNQAWNRSHKGSDDPARRPHRCRPVRGQAPELAPRP